MLPLLSGACLGKRLQDRGFSIKSTGVYHFPLDKAAAIACRTIKEYLEAHPEIERVRMVCFDERTKGAYDSAIAALEEDK